MPYNARILLDSIGPHGARLTTMELTYPRFVHSEFMTHRMFSRNAASSRAIPVEKMLERVETDPVMPIWWGKNQKGMQAEEELAGASLEQAKRHWLRARDEAVIQAQYLMEGGAHKQIVNRILEPWCWITVIATATDWANFFWLRCHKDAQPELRHVAALALKAYHESIPVKKARHEWHCPFIQDDEWSVGYETVLQLSVARCARVSYLTHDGIRDHQKDLELFERLKGSGHWSPFEHVAYAIEGRDCYIGNFENWCQYRKTFSLEHRRAMTETECAHLIQEMEALGALAKP